MSDPINQPQHPLNPTPPVVLALLLVNALVYGLQWLGFIGLNSSLALWPLASPLRNAPDFALWQLLSYAFLHVHPLHLLANMLGLWIFGSPLARIWGPLRFLSFYFICVAGAALLHLLFSSLLYRHGQIIGASGGVMGLLGGFALMYPRARVLLLVPPIPLRAIHLVAVIALLDFTLGVFLTRPIFAHFAHLGGLASGFAIFGWWQTRGDLPAAEQAIGERRDRWYAEPQMRIGIGAKSFIALVGTTLAALVAATVFVNHSFQRGFVDYVNDLRRGRVEVLVERLAQHYEQDGDWEFMRRRPDRLAAFLGTGRHHPPPEERRRPRRARDPMGFSRGITIFDAEGNRVLGPPEVRGERFDIVVGEEVVGHVISAPVRSLSDRTDLRFAQRQRDVLGWTLFGSTLLAALVAWFLARQLVRPVHTLTRGTRALTAGQYDTRVDVRQQDELGRLASDFNILAGTLERAAQQRRELMADVSHELRTPLAALRAQLSALQDGVRPVNDEALQTLDDQVSRLVGLVDELYDLSLADAGALRYEKETLNLAEVLRESLTLAEPRFQGRQLDVDAQIDGDALPVFADRRRLEQLFANLFENSARYTDAGGKVLVRAARDGQFITVCVEDSAPGVPEEDLPRLFERLYRVERSRSRQSGGAGLGLALVEKIAEAHGARVEAAKSALGGLMITLQFPAAQSGDDA